MSLTDDKLNAIKTDLTTAKAEIAIDKAGIQALQASVTALTATVAQLQANPPEMTPAQQALLDSIKTQADDVLAGVQDLDATLGPNPGGGGGPA